MPIVKKMLRRAISLATALIPLPLPQYPSELFELTEAVLELGGMPKDNDSYREALAEILLHLDNRILWVSKFNLMLRLKRRIANQVSYDMLMAAKRERELKKNEQQAVQSAPSEVV